MALLGNYGLPNSDNIDSREYETLCRVLCRAAISDYLVKFTAWGSLSLRNAFKAICSDAPDKTSDELRGVLCRTALALPDIYVSTDRICKALLFSVKDIPTLDLYGIETAVHTIGTQTLAVALKIAGFAVDFLEALPKRDSDMISEDMEFMGPVRISAIEEARDKAQSVLDELIKQEKIKVPAALRDGDADDKHDEMSDRCALSVLADLGSDMEGVFDFDGFLPNGAGGIAPSHTSYTSSGNAITQVSKKPRTLNEDDKRDIIDCAVALREAARDFILQKAGNKADEVRALIGEYSKEETKARAAAMWEQSYEYVKQLVYVRGLEGVNGELKSLLCCVPRAKTKEFLATLTSDADKRVWHAVRRSSLFWEDIGLFCNVDINGALDECTPSVVAIALVKSSPTIRQMIIDSLSSYDGGRLSPEITIKEWGRDIVKHEIERLIEIASQLAPSTWIEKARDEVLSCLMKCKDVQQWVDDRMKEYSAV